MDNGCMTCAFLVVKEICGASCVPREYRCDWAITKLPKAFKRESFNNLHKDCPAWNNTWEQPEQRSSVCVPQPHPAPLTVTVPPGYRGKLTVFPDGRVVVESPS